MFTILFVFSLRVYNANAITKILMSSPPFHCRYATQLKLSLVHLVLFIFHFEEFHPHPFRLYFFVVDYILNIVPKVKTIPKNVYSKKDLSSSFHFFHASGAHSQLPPVDNPSP